MDFSDPIMMWLGAGVLLMLAELVIPGGIVIFLGLAGVLVAGSLQLGIIEGWIQALTLWFVASMVLLLSCRNLAQKLVGGDTRVDSTDEELAIYGETAVVTETIGPGQQTGRIEFQGSTWPALGDGQVITSGSLVRIICHENIGMVVEPLADAAAPANSH